MRPLIMEDDARVARHLARGLGEAGHIVGHAIDGDIGMALAREYIYDVMVVDRKMPGVDGIAVMPRLREQNVSTPVPTLIATAAPWCCGWAILNSPRRQGAHRGQARRSNCSIGNSCCWSS